MASVAELQQLVAQLQTQLDTADEQGVRKASADFTRELKRAEEVLKTLPNDQKKSFGKALNDVRKQATSAVEARLAAIAEAAARKDLERGVDVTLPGRARTLGHLNPITIARREIEEIFAQIGFTVAVGPQVETDFHNFEALAMPKDHPARDMQDTFYVDGAPDVVLRTHPSPVQIRTMLAQKPPVRVIVPGTVYRRDDDATHSPMFNQVEGLCVDVGVSFADLKGVLLHFARRYFGEKIGVRLRPSFFPFTEPSAEIDFTCVFCGGAGCRTCKGSGWIEIGGAGMVDPEVFRHVNYDSEKYTGFAFGWGIDRMAMLKYGIPVITQLFEGDVRFARQFR